MKYAFRYCKFIATVAQVSTGDVAWTDAPILFSQCMQVVMWHMRLISTTHAWQYAEKGFYTSFFFMAGLSWKHHWDLALQLPHLDGWAFQPHA